MCKPCVRMEHGSFPGLQGDPRGLIITSWGVGAPCELGLSGEGQSYVQTARAC